MLSRRALLAGLPLLGACAKSAADTPAVFQNDLSLKGRAPFPLGNIVTLERLRDPVWAALIRKHFDRLTPACDLTRPMSC